MSESVCIKVKNLRKLGYKDLEEWMDDPDNLYVGRRGRIFITDKETKEKRIFHYKQSKWANPYTLKEYSLDDSLILFRKHIHDSGLEGDLGELMGMNLGCFCDKQKDDEGIALCHAEVLCQLVEEKVIQPIKKELGDLLNK